MGQIGATLSIFNGPDGSAEEKWRLITAAAAAAGLITQRVNWAASGGIIADNEGLLVN